MRSGLAALLPTGDKKSDEHIEKAIKKIDDSLKPEYWDGGSRLTPKGAKVFDLERDAVEELQKVKAVSTASAIGALVAIDRGLAHTAILDAVAAGGRADDINQAYRHLAKGDEWAAAPDPDKAIDEYKKAWTNAMRAVR